MRVRLQNAPKGKRLEKALEKKNRKAISFQRDGQLLRDIYIYDLHSCLQRHEGGSVVFWAHNTLFLWSIYSLPLKVFFVAGVLYKDDDCF